MALTITGKLIRSAYTQHTAELVGQVDADTWRVSWLPGRVLTRIRAVAAMNIAEAVGLIPVDCDPWAYDDEISASVEEWAAELGLTGPAAMARASEPPRAGSPSAETEAG
jgi:hypothetical protein